METNQERLGAEMDSHQDEMKAIMKAGQEKIGAEKKACLEAMETCLEKTARIKSEPN
jgi:hypothetical protein